ncbi:hypothetical protein [Phragmitibacter flavus]|nr:hypothetical protein [Phragmitibacter flavus]
MLFSACSTEIRVHREELSRQVQWSQAVAPYAMLSLLAYEGPGNGNIASMKGGRVSTKLSELPDDRSGFVTESRVRLAKDGWRRIYAFDEEEEGTRAAEELYFEVWEKRVGGEIKEIVFAFEGTDSFADMRTNMRWFRLWRARGDRGDQYDAVNKVGLELHRKLWAQTGGKARFTATGHSLGGGLAQHFYYSALPHMDRAVVFDTTPVTGYQDLSKEQRGKFLREVYRDEFPTYRVLRVHEDGELLEYLRDFTQKFFPQDSVIRAVEFKSHTRGGALIKHGMARLVSKIFETELAAKEEIEEENQSGGPAKSKRFRFFLVPR